jgi:hypothetical protein
MSKDHEIPGSLADGLSRWFERAGVHRPEVAVDLADVVQAAKEVEMATQVLMTLEPDAPADSERALDQLGRIHAWIFTEIKPHIAELEVRWPSIEDPIVARFPQESGGDDQ